MKKLLIFCLIFCCITCKKKSQNIRIVPVEESWIKGELYKHRLAAETDRNTHPIKKTVLITLSGFEGGLLPRKSLFALAEHGYDVFSLAYFAPPSVLPNKLAEIPIEYLAKAVRWIKSQKRYQNYSVVLLGVSKGAELALLYGSYYQNINGIIAYSPSCILLPDIVSAKDTSATQSPWSYQYKPLSFAPVKKIDTNKTKVVYEKYISPWLSNVAVFKKAMIHVEKITCPLLLLAGNDDKMWGSAKMSNLIQYKLEANFKPRQATSFIFKNAGHRFFWFGTKPPKTSETVWHKSILNVNYQFLLGGTHQGNIEAMKNSQQEVLRFLQQLDKPLAKNLNQ